MPFRCDKPDNFYFILFLFFSDKW